MAAGQAVLSIEGYCEMEKVKAGLSSALLKKMLATLKSCSLSADSCCMNTELCLMACDPRELLDS